MKTDEDREDAYIQGVVDSAPPLTPAQIARLTGLFADGGDDQ